MDVLTDVLNTLELKGWVSSRRELVYIVGFTYPPTLDKGILWDIMATP